MTNLTSLADRVFAPDEITEESEASAKYQHIKKAADTFEIPYKDMLILASIESGFRSDSTSETGYVGMYQLNPKDYPGYDLKDYRENTNIAAEHYANLPEGSLLDKVVYFNQGRKGGREILAAGKVQDGVDKHSDSPWNRVKNMAYNLSDSSLNKLYREYSDATGSHYKEIGLTISRQGMIEKLVGHYRNEKDDTRNMFLVDKPSIIQLYLLEQQNKVNEHSIVADDIIEEYK